MRRKILALSLVLAMAASVLSPAAMAQTVSDSLPTVIATSESTAESTSAAESESTAESTSTAESVSTPASAPAAESTSDAVASENTNAAQPQADEVAIDETNFPDANFREHVKHYDTDGNGSFSQAELDAVTEMNVSFFERVQNLKGIEYFTALTSLNVSDNQLTSLDVSANTVLTELNVYNNQLTSLDVSGCTGLISLYVHNNQLTSLDVSKNTALQNLYVGGNQLTSLDVSANTALTDLYAPYNQLTSLDVSANTALISLSVFENQLISLKLGNKPSWEYTVDNPTQLSLTAKAGAAIDLKTYAPFFDASKVSNVQGGTIDTNGVLTGWTSGSPVTYTYDAGFEQVLNVEITIQDEAQTTEVAIDEANFPDANFREVVKRFDKDGNGSFSQAELDAVKGLSPFNEGIQNLKGIEYFTALKYLDVGSNQLTTLDVSANTALTELEASGNQLTSLDVSANTALTNLSVKYNQLTSLDVSGCTMLTNLDVESNKLTTLDVSTNTALSRLSVRENQLTNLDISANTALINLNLSTNKLTKLDLSANTALTSLNVYNNQLTELDLSANTALTSLNVSGNQLTALNVSANTKLTDLYVENNQLTELDVSANTVLTNLGVSYNQLTSLDLSANEQLFQLSAKGTSLTALRLGNLMTWDLFDVDNPTKVSLTAETGTAIDLKTYAPFFDASKVSNVQGGTIDTNGVLTGWTSGSPVTYTYDAGFEQVLNVEITVQDEAQATEVTIDETNFPDANFREFVKQYDTDKNGSFSQAELDAVTEIAASLKGIQSLKGVEYFTALTDLHVANNQLTSLDVSKNTALTDLHVANNQLTSLDVSANTALTSLNVGGNQLTSLDVSKNTALTDLHVADNQLTSLDVSSNQLTSLDVSANTALTNLNAPYNQLTALKLGHVPAFGYTIDNPTKVSLTAKAGTAIDLKTYAPFFDASKVSNVQGGTIDANGVLTGWTSGSPVTYTYDAGFEQVLNVSIVIVDEDLKGLSLVATPFSKTYNGKAVTEQELIAGAKATYEGKEVSGKWSVENLPEMKDVGTYRPVLTFTPDSAEYVGGTIETSVQINPAPFSVWVGLSNYNINTGDKLPTVSLQYGGTPNGEVLQSTVEPVFTGMPEQSTAGTYTIVLSNAKEVLESLKAQPTAKNYTIQLWDKASLFISRYIQLPNAPTSPVEGTTGRLLMEKTFTNVPESLKAVGLDSVEKVTDKLLASVTGATKDNTVMYDVHYSISADGQTWNALTPEQFPKEGLTITLPYPEGVDTKANDFTAMHMFTQDVNGFKTGDVEVIKAVKTDAGLQMTVKGFSPIAITWAKAGTTPPIDGGNGGNVVTPPTGGNGTTTQPTTPNPGTGAIAQTGDNSAVAVWGIVMALCATAAAGLMIVKSKGKKKP